MFHGLLQNLKDFSLQCVCVFHSLSCAVRVCFMLCVCSCCVHLMLYVTRSSVQEREGAHAISFVMRRADADADKAAALRMMAASFQVCSKFKCSELPKKFPGSKLPTAQLSKSSKCFVRVPKHNRLVLQEEKK